MQLCSDVCLYFPQLLVCKKEGMNDNQDKGRGDKRAVKVPRFPNNESGMSKKVLTSKTC